MLSQSLPRYHSPNTRPPPPPERDTETASVVGARVASALRWARQYSEQGRKQQMRCRSIVRTELWLGERGSVVQQLDIFLYALRIASYRSQGGHGMREGLS